MTFMKSFWEDLMRGSSGRVARIALLVVVALAMVGSGCQKEDAAKSAAKGQAGAGAAKDPVAGQKAGEAPRQAEPKKEETKEAEPKKEEAKKQEPPPPKEPSAVERLEAIRKTLAVYSTAPGELEKTLGDLKTLSEKSSDADTAFFAYALGARTRVDHLILAGGEAGAQMARRLMALDGKLPAGKEPALEDVADYYRSLAADFLPVAAKASKQEDGDKLKAAAALLNWMAEEKMVAAGKTPGPRLVLPAEWGSKAEPSAGEGKPEVAPPAGDLPPAKEADKPTAGGDEKIETPTTADGEVKPAAPEGALRSEPFVDPGAPDVATLLTLAAGRDEIGLRARFLVLQRLLAGVEKGRSRLFLRRWVEIADGVGPLLCSACGQLSTVPEQNLGEAIFIPGNGGIVCPEALGDLKKGVAVRAAVAARCLAHLGVKNQDVTLVTPLNALVFRFHFLARQALAGIPTDASADPFVAELGKAAGKLEAGLQASLALFPTIDTYPRKKWEEMKEQLVLNSELTPGSPSFEYLPLEVSVTDEKGVSEAMRPVATCGGEVLEFSDLDSGLRFPGRQVIDVAGIARELEAKNARLKEEKAAFDERLGAYLKPVTIRGTVFKKPDFSIPSVVTAAGKLAAAAGALEAGAFPYLADGQVLNHVRPEWPEFKDTVGKAALFAVDHQTPALLFKRVVDSYYYADYKDDRLVKGTGVMDTIPTVYFTEKFLDDAVLDTTYRRPILVYITDGGQVRFYPPTNRTRKGKMTPKRHPRRRDIPWPGKYRHQVDPRTPDPLWNLFVAYTRVTGKNFEGDVVGIASAMKRKWDNGNVFYLVAGDKAQSGWVVKVADLLTRLPESKPLADLDKAYPGYACDAADSPELCTRDLVVLFPDVEIPHLPGKKKVKEVESKVYCDKDDIAAKINAKRGAIKFCYDPELQKNPNLKGKVVYNFTIGATGRITKISVAQDGLGNKKVVNCTRNIIKKINFRRPIGGECVIRYPYVFKP